MKREPSASRAPVLMVVHAHPDDESSQTGGILARYAAAGWHTVLVTCTDGSQGDGADGAKPGQPGHDPRQVAARRSAELDSAATVLGVGEVVKLGYPDSGLPGDGEDPPPQDSFSRRPLVPMVARMLLLLRRYQPQVIVTYPPDGFSGHPDHIRTHDLVRVALHNLAEQRIAAAGASVASAAVGEPHLYYITLSRSRLRALGDAARRALGPDGWLPPDEVAVDDAEVTTIIDVTAHWPTKMRALAAHASQSDAAALLHVFAAAGDAGFGEYAEEFVRAEPLPGLRVSPESGFGEPFGLPGQ